MSAERNIGHGTVTIGTLKLILEAFNRHDLDTIMEFFSDDCSFDFPRGPEPWGQRFVGKDQVRKALASRFEGIPDVHYGGDRHWVSAFSCTYFFISKIILFRQLWDLRG